jgi:hypothetical protein
MVVHGDKLDVPTGRVTVVEPLGGTPVVDVVAEREDGAGDAAEEFGSRLVTGSGATSYVFRHSRTGFRSSLALALRSEVLRNTGGEVGVTGALLINEPPTFIGPPF